MVALLVRRTSLMTVVYNTFAEKRWQSNEPMLPMPAGQLYCVVIALSIRRQQLPVDVLRRRYQTTVYIHHIHADVVGPIHTSRLIIRRNCMITV